MKEYKSYFIISVSLEVKKRKQKLEEFIKNFNNAKEKIKNSSKQTMRSCIDEFLF